MSVFIATMEKWQVVLYLAAILAGLALASESPAIPGVLVSLLWPMLGLLLYVTFTQIPLLGMHRALRDGRFLLVAMLANFLLIPLLIWCLLPLLPVPLLALVVFIIAASQYQVVAASTWLFAPLLLVFSLFLLLTALMARLLTKLFRLPVAQGRTLAFSLGTRNSFVVLPLALAMPAPYELVAVTIVFQSLVELIGMAIFVWWIPNKVLPD